MLKYTEFYFLKNNALFLLPTREAQKLITRILVVLFFFLLCTAMERLIITRALRDHLISNGHKNFPLCPQNFLKNQNKRFQSRKIFTRFKLNFNLVSTNQPFDVALHSQHHVLPRNTKSLCVRVSLQSVTSFCGLKQEPSSNANFLENLLINYIFTSIAHYLLKIGTNLT